MAGRRPKLTPEVSKDICCYVEQGLPYKAAALLAGVSERSFYNWRNRGEKAKSGRYFQFLQDLTRAQQKFKLRIHTAILEQTDRGDARTGLQLLKLRHPEEYSEKRILRHEGEIAMEAPEEADPLNVENLDLDERLELARLLAKAEGSGEVP